MNRAWYWSGSLVLITSSSAGYRVPTSEFESFAPRLGGEAEFDLPYQERKCNSRQPTISLFEFPATTNLPERFTSMGEVRPSHLVPA